MKKEMYGVENLKIAILAICKIQLLARKFIENKKKGWFSNIQLLIQFIIKNRKDWKVFKSFNYRLVDEEFKDLSPKETEELIIYICTYMDTTDTNNTLQFIKSALNTYIYGFKIFK